jgi:hypothetical protein
MRLKLNDGGDTDIRLFVEEGDDGVRVFAEARRAVDVWASQRLVPVRKGDWRLNGAVSFVNDVGRPIENVRARVARSPGIDSQLSRVAGHLSSLYGHAEATGEHVGLFRLLKDVGFAPRSGRGLDVSPDAEEHLNSAAQRKWRESKRTGHAEAQFTAFEKAFFRRLVKKPISPRSTDDQ